TGTGHAGVHVPSEHGGSFALAFEAASGPAVLRGDAVVDQPYVDRGAVGFQRQSAASRLTVPKAVGGALTYERAEQRLQRWGHGVGFPVHLGVDARRAAELDSVGDRVVQGGAAVSVHDAAGVGERRACEFGEFGGLSLRRVVVPTEEPFGQFTLEHDRLEMVALDVVEVGDR